MTALKSEAPAASSSPAVPASAPAPVSPASPASSVPSARNARPATGAAPAVRPAYRERPFVRLLLGEGASTVGDQVWYVALSWAAVRSGGPASAGAIMTAS